MEGKQTIYLCTDTNMKLSVQLMQVIQQHFPQLDMDLHEVAQIRSEADVKHVMHEASIHDATIIFTLFQPELREMLKQESIHLNVRTVDIMGPIMQALFNTEPQTLPIWGGGKRDLNDAYFNQIDAIEFAVQTDDGRDPHAILEADFVIVGISRTSKTPLSIFLAHNGYRVANVPLIPEVKPPSELFQLASNRLIGVTMEAEKMVRLRRERLKTVGLPFRSQYAQIERVKEELAYAHSWMKQWQCTVIDVTNRAIEEIAAIITEQ